MPTYFVLKHKMEKRTRVEETNVHKTKGRNSWTYPWFKDAKMNMNNLHHMR